MVISSWPQTLQDVLWGTPAKKRPLQNILVRVSSVRTRALHSTWGKMTSFQSHTPRQILFCSFAWLKPVPFPAFSPQLICIVNEMGRVGRPGKIPKASPPGPRAGLLRQSVCRGAREPQWRPLTGGGCSPGLLAAERNAAMATASCSRGHRGNEIRSITTSIHHGHPESSRQRTAGRPQVLWRWVAMGRSQQRGQDEGEG